MMYVRDPGGGKPDKSSGVGDIVAGVSFAAAMMAGGALAMAALIMIIEAMVR